MACFHRLRLIYFAFLFSFFFFQDIMLKNQLTFIAKKHFIKFEKKKKSKIFLFFKVHKFLKAVVAGPAGAASAGPLFVPNMLSAVSLFAVSVASVVFTCDLIPSNLQKCRVLLIRLSLTHVVARVINRHSQGVKTIRTGVTRRANMIMQLLL